MRGAGGDDGRGFLRLRRGGSDEVGRGRNGQLRTFLGWELN